jgi:hypothetical protein
MLKKSSAFIGEVPSLGLSLPSQTPWLSSFPFCSAVVRVRLLSGPGEALFRKRYLPPKKEAAAATAKKPINKRRFLFSIISVLF